VKGLKKCQLILLKHTLFSLFDTYMVASVLLPTTSARIFYRKQKEVDPGSETLGGGTK
jgi:hypothetical protein